MCQDGILFGMVGAYDWDGGVLKEGINGRIMPPREAFESEFPLELKNHAAYLGTDTSLTTQCRVILQYIKKNPTNSCYLPTQINKYVDDFII